MAEAPKQMKPRPELPTLPERGYSGSAIKARVIRAMEEQLNAERVCLAALDGLIEVIDRVDTYPPPPPPKHPSSPGFRSPLDSAPH